MQHSIIVKAQIVLISLKIILLPNKMNALEWSKGKF
jgi:hypothetical protein